MIKRILAILLFVFLLLTGCSNNTDNTTDAETKTGSVSTVTIESTNTSVVDTTEYNVDIYSGDYGSVTLRSISTNEIIFDVVNNASEAVDYRIDIALDGEVIAGYNDSSEMIDAGEQGECVYYITSDLSYTEHKYLSVYGTISLENGGNKFFDVCDIEIGDTENKENIIPSGEEIYSSDNVIVEYTGVDARGVSFTIDNQLDSVISVYFDGLYLNNDTEQDYGIYAISIPAHSKNVLDVNMLSINNEYYDGDVEKISGGMKVSSNGNSVSSLSTLDSFKFSIDID